MKSFTILCGICITFAAVTVAAVPTVLIETKASRGWTKGEGSIPEHHRLIGLGCGPNRLTYTAAEEDHFIAPCYAIGTPQDLCPTYGEDYPPDLPECVLYLGDGW
jgi:hypothetical protein